MGFATTEACYSPVSLIKTERGTVANRRPDEPGQGEPETGWVLFPPGASLYYGFLTGRDGMTIFGQRQTPKKRRKSRTAFTNHQIYELEKRFLYQKYLSPADRDQIAQQLGLTNAQVITWFQNRRAKLKRDLEEMKADVESAKKLGPSGQMDIVALAELEQNSEAAGGGGGGCGRAKSRPGSPTLPPGVPQAPGAGPLQLSPASPLTDQPASSQDCSEDEEDEEIDVDD